ncbi:MAG: NAD(P)/FAD-dependent oxidoreductase [Tenericutes bacterium]|nr:NAD(P)/FAD-dependent oxidoreductase [Bacilli bacterium]MDD3995123.1 NAD(P)/FAD-dependent oxidoreductase [Bacilli bacterium]MDD4623906.1 NAD(P)/FAD-dependent oxidoreductase [Bacilli bacterium]MDD4831637.1 NAD(P)/FAD-dependent oxidoreductase [Bacilli bacterium]NLV89979.1 NAD(P)/FAD-dependent oxidoreductase [Mycoplasmatota bacterium]
MQKYDVVIVGAGCSGIFTALEIVKNSNLKVLMIEKGNSIKKRVCPKRTTGKCMNCNPCNITTGFSGAGAFSDGKLTLSPDVGGNLKNYLGYEKTQELIDYVDSVYLSFGADDKIYGNDHIDKIKEIEVEAIKNNLKLIVYPLRHLGTDQSYEIYSKIEEYLKEKGVDFKFRTMVEDLIIENNVVKGVKTKDETIKAKYVVLSVGREGSEWLRNICHNHNIEAIPSVVDIGVRVEVRNEVMENINKYLYEGKFIYNSKTFDDTVRTFCQNPSGEVVIERYEDNLITVNGHSYKDSKTNNTNLALLVSKTFTQPFKDSIGYAKSIAKLANMLADGKVLVQRYGDLKRGRRTTEERLMRGNIVPTLKDAVPGDLSLVLPYRIIKSIEEMIEALNGVAPGFNSAETLLYGVECKFYNNKVIVDSNFQTNLKNLYALGDGAGITRGIIQSNSNGVYVGRHIVEEEK